jgi:hypothetical protein
VKEHIVEAKRRLDKDRVALIALSDRVTASENKLSSAFAALKKKVLA